MTLPTLDGRRTAFHGFIRDLIKSGKIDGSRWSIELSEIKNLAHTEQATNLCRLQKVEQTMRDASKTNQTELVISKKSMFDIDYEPYDVIYFDPPYADTKGYDKAKFDFDRFHSLIDRLVNSGKAVFVSEYKRPTDKFGEVLAVEKQMSQCDHLTKVVTERLFKGVL
jgi:site-specific DNA-adenine methylase